ncbi:MAG: PepSY domain-containing protein [Phycisphaerae bacterium]|nr:PepSY domain-containing protein [Phycisphaerae bacterium]
MLRKHWKLSSVIVVVLAGLTLSIGALAGRQVAQQDKKATIDQVPDAVKATLLSQGGAIEEIEIEAENGRTIYEADVTVGGQKVEMKVAADGSLLGKEVDDEDNDEEDNDRDQESEDEDEAPLSIDQVPDVVRATLLREAQGGTIKEIEQENEDGQIVYGAEVVLNGQEFDLKVAPDTGELISKETDDEDDEEPQEK